MKTALTLSYTNANKAAWNASAHLHGQGNSWNDRLRAASQPVVTACVSNEFRLQRLEEHPHLNREVDIAVYEYQSAQWSLCHTLVAQAT